MITHTNKTQKYGIIALLVAGSAIAIPGLIESRHALINASELEGISYFGSILISIVACTFLWRDSYREDPWIPALFWFILQGIIWTFFYLGGFRLVAKLVNAL